MDTTEIVEYFCRTCQKFVNHVDLARYHQAHAAERYFSQEQAREREQEQEQE